MQGTTYVWPIFPDGQATFETGDGGWVLTTNAESIAATGAGTSAIRFALRRHRRRLSHPRRHGRQLRRRPDAVGDLALGEESDEGLVWECDPAGVLAAEARPALGAFKHEAVAVDPVGGRLYLTEDDNPRRLLSLHPGLLPGPDRRHARGRDGLGATAR